MTDLVGAHRHCRVCGKAIPEESTTCSKACAAKREASLRSRKLNTYLFYGLGFFILVLLLFAVYKV